MRQEEWSPDCNEGGQRGPMMIQRHARARRPLLPWNRLLAVPSVGLGVLMLAACGMSCGADAAVVPPRYVAMGSSFAAGPMIPDEVPDQSCGRSTHNYAHLVAADFGLNLTDVSCIGATTDNVATT